MKTISLVLGKRQLLYVVLLCVISFCFTTLVHPSIAGAKADPGKYCKGTADKGMRYMSCKDAYNEGYKNYKNYSSGSNPNMSVIVSKCGGIWSDSGNGTNGDPDCQKGLTNGVQDGLKDNKSTTPPSPGKDDNKAVANPDSKLVAAAKEACQGTNTATWKKGQRPDCQTAYIYAFTHYQDFVSGNGTVNETYIKNTYCTGGGTATPEDCLKGARLGATKSKDVGGDPSKITDPSDNQGQGVGTTDDCDGSFPALGWIVCPVVDGINKAVEKLDSAINDLLTIGTSQIFDDSDPKSTGAAYHAAWSNFRNIALGLVFIAGLIMIIATALGYEILDAYTIRKVLPRVLIAIIFIALSWSILDFLVNFFNDVGNGIRALIYAPFIHMQDFHFSGTGMTAILLGALTSMFFMGAIGLLSFGGTALLAVVIAFLVLVLRELIIIFLVIIAPIGIASMILPGTKPAWDIWRKGLISMLVAFPVITGMIAIGRVFSVTSYNSNPDSWLTQIIAFIAYVLPYFLLPFAFRMAGGFMATLAGMANDRSRGGFDRLKNFRAGRMKKIHDKRMSGNSWVGTGRTGGLYRRAAAGGEHGSWSMTRRGRQRWNQERNKMYEGQAAEMEKTGMAARAFNDDDASSLAVQRGMTRGRFIDEYSNMRDNNGNLIHTRQDAIAALTRAEQATGVRIGSDAMAVAAQKFRIASSNTAYGAGPEGLEQMRTEVQDMVGRGMISTHDAAGWMKSNRGRADYNANAYGQTVAFLEGGITAQDQIAGAFRGADPRDILGSHQNSVETFAAHAYDHVNQAFASGDQYQIDNAMADVANIHSMLSSTSPQKAAEFADEVLAAPVPSGIRLTRPVVDANGRAARDADNNIVMEEYDATVRQYIDSVRSDERNHPAFHNRSREYASAREAASAAGAVPPPTDPEG